MKSWSRATGSPQLTVTTVSATRYAAGAPKTAARRRHVAPAALRVTAEGLAMARRYRHRRALASNRV